MLPPNRKVHWLVKIWAARFGIEAVSNSDNALYDEDEDELTDVEFDIEINDAGEIERRARFLDI